MAMKSVLVVLGVLLFPPSGVLAQPATSAEPPDVPADIEEWMRTAWGMEPQVLGVTDTHFLSSLSASERQGAFLFKQRCNTCHYSTMSTTRGAGAWSGPVAHDVHAPSSDGGLDADDRPRIRRARARFRIAVLQRWQHRLGARPCRFHGRVQAPRDERHAV